MESKFSLIKYNKGPQVARMKTSKPIDVLNRILHKKYVAEKRLFTPLKQIHVPTSLRNLSLIR